MWNDDEMCTVWVCTDCYFAHANGASEHDGEWYCDGSDTPCDRPPLGLLDDAACIASNVCAEHYVDVDDDGDRIACENCGSDDYESGEDTFSWRRCEGCGSTLGGSRYRLAVWFPTSEHAS